MSATANLTNALRRLGESDTDVDDAELLRRYAAGNDQAAFATLVRRYGPLVLGVARRQLADRHRADDVFQATFLALARSAATLGGRPLLVNWLYTVALRHARKARARDAGRKAVEIAAPPPVPQEPDPLDAVTGRELLQAVDEELARLPKRLRLPVLLCCVEGLSRDEAANRLGCSDGAVRGRLQRGRRLLAARLSARGLAPSALILTALATVTVPADLRARVADQAGAPWAKSIPATVAALAANTTWRSLFPAAGLASGVLAALLAGLVGAAPAVLMMGRQPPPATGTSAVPPRATISPPERKAEGDDMLPVGATLRFGSPRFRHPTAIEQLAVSPDGKVAVACSGTKFHGAVRAYDLATGRVLFAFDDLRDVEEVAFSPDGKTLAVRVLSTGKHAILLYDATTGKRTGRIACPYVAHQLAFAPNGKRLAFVDNQKNVLHLLDIAKGEVLHTFQHTELVFAIAFAPDGKHIAAAGYEQENGFYLVRLWEADTGKEARRFTVGQYGIRSLAFSADGATLAVGRDYGKPAAVTLFELATGKERSLPLPDTRRVRSLAFSPDGKTLAAAGTQCTRLFNVATGKETARIDREAFGLRFSPDGAALVGAVAGTIYRWDAATGKSLIPEGGDSPVAQIAVPVDGKRVVTRGQDGDAHVWDAVTGAYLRRVTVRWQRGLALSPDGRLLVWPELDETIEFPSTDLPGTTRVGSRLRMMDLATGTEAERFEGFRGDAHDVFFTTDGKSVITAERYGRDAAVRVWDVTTGKVTHSFAATWKPTGRVWRSRLSPDSKTLAVSYQGEMRGASVESEVKLWDIATGKETAGPTPHWFAPEVMAFAPDGETLAVAAQPSEPTIQFRDLVTGEVRGEFRGARERVTALGYGPDGRLFTGAADGSVLAWPAKVVRLQPRRK